MKEYLPLGSVVILKGGEKSVMIYGRKQSHAETNVEYDYVACLFPEGNISKEFTYLFNHDKIGEIIFTGYSNDADKELVAKLTNLDAN